MMTRTIALLFATTMMFTLSACDTGDEDTVEDRAAEQPDAGSPDAVAGKRGPHGKHNPADRLCAELECTDAQATEIAALFEDLRPERDDAAREAHKAARADAHKALADAFRADDFDPSVLAKAAPPRDRAEHEDKMVDLAVELHKILTPEQRAKLADKIAAGGPMMFGHHGMKGGKHGKHGGEGHGEWKGEGKPDPAERIAHKVEEFCEPIACTEAQVGQLTATFTGAHEARRDARAERKADKPDLSPVADLFRADTLDQAALRAAFASVHPPEGREGGHAEQAGALLGEIHGILTPEQRATVADKIEAEGPHAVMGGKHGGKHGNKGKRGHGRGGPERDAD